MKKFLVCLTLLMLILVIAMGASGYLFYLDLADVQTSVQTGPVYEKDLKTNHPAADPIDGPVVDPAPDADAGEDAIEPTGFIEPTELKETKDNSSAAETAEPADQSEISGELFLTVSEITFSVIGESEDIYAGTVPLSEITWESQDESVITVKDGVLTAVGVGTTTVTASCEGQELSCKAGCLAANMQDLSSMTMNVLRSPKRKPPQVGDEVLSYYEDAAMLGDSITYGFFTYEARNGRLGSPRCLCRGSLGIHNMLTHTLDLFYHGVETPVEDVLADVDPQKVFILLGTNDVMVRPADTVIDELDQLLNRILNKNNDLEIYLQSVFPIVNENVLENSTNERILAYNAKLQEFAEERGYHYVPVAPYLQDHIPGFAKVYEQDKYHPNYEGVCTWIDALRAYAYIQQIKGE